ncbi:MAG: xanthine phosphoribosyltransferase [Aminipila sp.]
MESLKQKILAEGQVLGEDIVKVDGFLNHQIDVKFMEQIGKEFRERFNDVKVDRILTVESSGISIACETSKFFDYIPVVFAKKVAPNTMAEGCFSAEAKSFTKGTVSNLRVAKRFLKPGENVLIVDDFLASGEASIALAKMVRKAGAEVAGIGAVIEKEFQGGSAKLREMGCRVESLAVIRKFENGKIVFA